jgi:hypothetical protein
MVHDHENPRFFILDKGTGERIQNKNQAILDCKCRFIKQQFPELASHLEPNTYPPLK